MATRAIVTSHPDVACDVCGRRLLRGEHADLFLAGGQRRVVCELCAPRASHEGWLREADDHTLSPRAARPQRGRTLLGRLRQLREPGSRSVSDKGSDGSLTADDTELGSYDFLDGRSPSTADGRSSADARSSSAGAPAASEPFIDLLSGGELSADADLDAVALDADEAPGSATRRPRGRREDHTNGDLKTARALQVFNVGEHPRRIAGVARSLGAPTVLTRPVGDSGSLVAIVVAWELCWYRYEVDLGDEAAGARLVAQGMELDELASEDRQTPNAAADERGALAALAG
jgi:hypothetical protein